MELEACKCSTEDEAGEGNLKLKLYFIYKKVGW